MYNPQLETFIRVADAGSFNKAAEESYITPTVQRFLDAAKKLGKNYMADSYYLQVYTAKQRETSLEVSFFL
ncbi:MAG: hypothetical protein ACLR2E_24490 [Lachnospiraceae bacterium]